METCKDAPILLVMVVKIMSYHKVHPVPDYQLPRDLAFQVSQIKLD